MTTLTVENLRAPSPRSKPSTTKRTAVALGVLLILQMLTAAVGLSFVQSFLDGAATRDALILGTLSMMFSGLLIATIGVLLFRVLSSTSRGLATWVLAIRATEFVVVIAFGLYLLQNSQTVPNHLLWVYILAGVAGVIFTGLLFTARLVPRPIAGLGLVGYSALLAGVVLGFTGVADMNAGAGQLLIVPGALFELIVLPLWLFTKGFAPVAPKAGGDASLSPALGRTPARIVGALFLSAFLLYGIGSSVATTAPLGSPPLVAGVALMLLNSAAVLAIGVLLVPTLRQYSAECAYAYLGTRVFEAALLGVGAIALLGGAAATNMVAYNIGMAGLGLGSLFFCVALYRSRLVPRPLAAWGFFGYAVFATGSVLELAGVSGAGLVGAAPGGLFELALAGWLLVRGFGTVRPMALAA
jgi:hypothetical protein